MALQKCARRSHATTVQDQVHTDRRARLRLSARLGDSGLFVLTGACSGLYVARNSVREVERSSIFTVSSAPQITHYFAPDNNLDNDTIPSYPPTRLLITKQVALCT